MLDQKDNSELGLEPSLQASLGITGKKKFSC